MRIAIMLGAVIALGAVAHAGRWPHPAAGRATSGAPEVVLTFDDGPHEDYTPLILDELQRRGIKATFFWVGYRVTGSQPRVDERIAIARRAAREGHLIGNHTIHHAKLCRGSAADAAREIDLNASIFHRVLGMPPYWFRAPYGARCVRLEVMLAERRLSHLHWDWDPQEWMHRDPDDTVAYVTRKLRRLEGRAVLLLHDTKRAAVEALPRILDWIEGDNRRRLRHGLPQIRLVPYAELARETLAPGLLDWLDDARDAAALRVDVAAGLLTASVGPPRDAAAPTRQARSAP
jgi:peptidoglycan/xylan/chitin deacetylase (PgdA/CDA1 family)